MQIFYNTVSFHMDKSKDVRTTLYYLRRDDLYHTVKPYSLEFDSKMIARSNFKTHKAKDVLIEDVRGKEHEFSFNKHGWAIVEMQSAMTYNDFGYQDRVDEIYCQELSLMLLDYLKPMNISGVQIFDTTVSPTVSLIQSFTKSNTPWQIRRRHLSFPFLPVDPTVQNQPAVRVHVGM